MSKKKKKEVARLKIQLEQLVLHGYDNLIKKLNLIIRNQNVTSRSSDDLINLLHVKERQLVWMDRESGPLVAEAKKVAGQVRSFYYLFLYIFL